MEKELLSGFSNEKGYGFMSTMDQDECFCHFTGIWRRPVLKLYPKANNVHLESLKVLEALRATKCCRWRTSFKVNG